MTGACSLMRKQFYRHHLAQRNSSKQFLSPRRQLLEGDIVGIVSWSDEMLFHIALDKSLSRPLGRLSGLQYVAFSISCLLIVISRVEN